MSNTDDADLEGAVYHCGIHDLVFEARDWCPQCEIEFAQPATEGGE